MMVDFRGPAPLQLPHRKPIPGPTASRRNDLQPLTKIHPDLPHATAIVDTSEHSAFQRPRGSSQGLTYPTASQAYNNPMFTSRRTPSQSTTSSATFAPSRTPSNVSSKISRTSSTKSGGSTTASSYVALMRKQKATVWCDRAQHEDPRIVAQQKAAKIRAAKEIKGAGRISEGRSSTSGSMGSGSHGVRKIRHHGVPKASGYSSANILGGGVPMRLSANEVGDEGTYNGSPNGSRTTGHHRTSSAHSRESRSQFLTVDAQQPRRYSHGSTPISGPGGSPEDIAELEETPMAGNHQQHTDYFSSEPGHGGSGGSGGSSEGESSFGNLTQMEAPKAKKEGPSSDLLERRGSVDERANTMGFMGRGRLFVANPD
ncbi:MAG: hypothetical protein Q9163_004410 [Psora crenata]